jgi:hypothetical protein
MYAVGWTLPSLLFVGAALEVRNSKDFVGMGSLVKETFDAWDVVVGAAVVDELVAPAVKL